MLFLSACNRVESTFVTYDYNSKINGYRDVFTITHIDAVDKQENGVKIKKGDFDEFDEKIRNLDEFFGVDKVYNVNKDTLLFQGKECYILTNGDGYFAFGEKQDGYYYLSELKATFNFYDFQNDKYVFKVFSIIPYLNEYIYKAFPPNIQAGEPIDDITVWIPYEWNYVKLFYSRLEYAQIDEEQKAITINAYAGATDTEFSEQTSTWIDQVSFSFISENNLNYIKFSADNFTIIDNDID